MANMLRRCDPYITCKSFYLQLVFFALITPLVRRAWQSPKFVSVFLIFQCRKLGFDVCVATHVALRIFIMQVLAS